MSDIIHGSCLCGGVRFEVRAPFIRANHCHCSRCRKHSGAAVCTQARVWRDQFKLLQGESLIRVYGEGEGAVAYFSPSWTAFQTDRGRCFSVIVDDLGCAQVIS